MSNLVRRYTDFVGEEPNGHPYEVYHADDVREVLQEKDARIAELEKYKTALEAHNAECDSMCNNAATCGYASYFKANGRRCTTCPVYMKIVL